MIFTETKLRGAYIIEPERMEDKRGFFARTFCEEEFKAHGLNPRVVQCNISFNVTTQAPRHQGTKKVMEYKPLSEREFVSL